MRVAGEKIKTARKKKKLSQAELAKGICTQATISNIENKNVCDSLDIFSSVCLRLDLQVEECIEGSSEKKLESLLNKVEELCFYFKHDEAYDLLKDYPDDIESSNRILETKFFYYKRITSLLGKKNNSEALFYLHRGSEISRDINIYNILSMNAIGILYELEDDIEKAKEIAEQVQDSALAKKIASYELYHQQLSEKEQKVKASKPSNEEELKQHNQLLDDIYQLKQKIKNL